MDTFKQPLRIRKAKQSLAKQPLVRKAKQPFVHKAKQLVGKFNNPFHKFRQDFPKSKKSRLRKMYQYISLRKYLFIHREFEFRYKYSKYSKDFLNQRNMRFYIGSRKEIHYRNIDSIGRFIGLAGRIIPRRVTKLTLRHQRLMTDAIKKARFLALLPFIENELHFKKKWREILDRRKKKKDKKKNRNKRRSIKTHPETEPRVPPFGTEPWTKPWTNPLKKDRFQPNPKTEPRVPPLGTEPWTNPLKKKRFEPNPKTEPRVPSLGTEPKISPLKKEGFKINTKEVKFLVIQIFRSKFLKKWIVSRLFIRTYSLSI